MRMFLVLLFTLLAAGPALGMPAISCHCFQDRSFDPQRAAAADPYFLATTQNSLLAATFQLAKKEVVRAKMSGTSGDELWVVNFVASRTGQRSEELQASRPQAGGWGEALAARGVKTSQLGQRVAQAMEGGGEDQAVARAVVEEILIGRAGTEPGVIEAFRQRETPVREMILAVFLAAQTGKPAMEFFDAVQSGNQSWGSLLNAYRIEAAEIEGRIAKMLN